MSLAKEIQECKDHIARYDQLPEVRLERQIARLMFKGIYRDPQDPTDDHYLTVEWAIQGFWAREILYHLPKLVAVHQKLTEGKYTQRKPFVWNDQDNSAYTFRSTHIAYQAFVIESQSLRYYYYLDLTKYHRKIHARSKKDILTYGDCRDKGFLFSIDDILVKEKPFFSKADGAHVHWSDTYWALWWILVAHRELTS